MSNIDYYGNDADYIHLKFGRMRKAFNFTQEFRDKHPNFVTEFIKYWDNTPERQFVTPLDIAKYVDDFNVPVHFYFNYTDTPAKDITEVYEYLIREIMIADTGFDDDGTYYTRGLDGEEYKPSNYLVVRSEE